MKSGIYLIRNIVNGKVYVGSTCSSHGFIARFASHRYELRNNKHPNKHLQHAWNKYGENSFEFTILEECNDDMLIIREKSWTIYHDSFNPDKGYNIRDVEERSSGMKGRHQSKEFKEVKRIAWLGKNNPNKNGMTKEHRQKLSMAKIGIKRKPFTKETKLKLSNALKGRIFSEEWKQKLSKAHLGLSYKKGKSIKYGSV